MNEETAIEPVEVNSPAPLGLDPAILSKLETYEDYLSFYVQLEETSTAFSWLKADTLRQMYKKFGDGSLKQLSKDLNQPYGTVINYVRTASAFPIDTREPMVSFSTHFQASLADSYDDQKKEWTTNNRFDWIKKAVDHQLSSRALARGIHEQKVATLAITDEEGSKKLDAVNKVGEIKQLLDALLQGVKKNDPQAYEKLVALYNRVYA